MSDVSNWETETAAVHRNDLPIGVNHEHAERIITTPTNKGLWLSIVGKKFVALRDMWMNCDREWIFGLCNFAQLST
jgi:hypothetical protein